MGYIPIIEFRNPGSLHTVKFILNTPPGTFGPTIIRGGGCLKRCENLIIFLPSKIHFYDFITIFLNNFHDFLVLFRGGGVYSDRTPKSQIWALIRGEGV